MHAVELFCVARLLKHSYHFPLFYPQLRSHRFGLAHEFHRALTFSTKICPKFYPNVKLALRNF